MAKMTEVERLQAVDRWVQAQPGLPQHLWSAERVRYESQRQAAMALGAYQVVPASQCLNCGHDPKTPTMSVIQGPTASILGRLPGLPSDGDE